MHRAASWPVSCCARVRHHILDQTRIQYAVPILRPTPLTRLPEALPESIGQLQALETLELTENRLAGELLRRTSAPLTLACTVLPSSIGNLKALTDLWLINNSFTGEH